MTGRGSNKTAKIVRALVNPDEKYMASELMHLPSLRFGFQKNSNGRHWNIMSRKVDIVQAIVQMPRLNVDHRIHRIHFWGNSRR